MIKDYAGLAKLIEFRDDGKPYWLVDRGTRRASGEIAGFFNETGRNIEFNGSTYMAHKLFYYMETGETPKILKVADGNKDNCVAGNIYKAIPFKYASIEDRAFYRLWFGIKARCYNTKQDNYGRYGAIGVTMCDEWLNSKEVFREWCLENGWKHGLAISRYGDTGNYSPDNCRFLTQQENNNEKSSTILTPCKVIMILNLIWSGESSYDDISSRFDISKSIISNIKYARCWRYVVIPWLYAGNADVIDCTV